MIINKITDFIDELKNLNFKEFYLWKDKFKIMSGFFSLIIILLLGYLLIISQSLSNLKIKEDQEEKLKKEFVEKKKQAVNIKLYEEQLAMVTKESNELLKQLPDRSQIEKLLLDINQAAVSRGLLIELFRPNKENIKEFYAELPIEIKVVGNYESIGKFTADVSQLSRVVIAENIELKIEKDQKISMATTMKTFRYLDQEELEEQAKKIEEQKKKDKKKKKSASTKNEKEESKVKK